MTDMDYAEVYERLMDAEETLTRVRALLDPHVVAGLMSGTGKRYWHQIPPTHIKARDLRAALEPPLYGVRENPLPHRADMKEGDLRQPCHYAYIEHEGPCRPTEDHHEHDAAGCLDCDCAAAPMNSAACKCPEWAR